LPRALVTLALPDEVKAVLDGARHRRIRDTGRAHRRLCGSRTAAVFWRRYEVSRLGWQGRQVLMQYSGYIPAERDNSARHLLAFLPASGFQPIPEELHGESLPQQGLASRPK